MHQTINNYKRSTWIFYYQTHQEKYDSNSITYPQKRLMFGSVIFLHGILEYKLGLKWLFGPFICHRLHKLSESIQKSVLNSSYHFWNYPI